MSEEQAPQTSERPVSNTPPRRAGWQIELPIEFDSTEDSVKGTADPSVRLNRALSALYRAGLTIRQTGEEPGDIGFGSVWTLFGRVEHLEALMRHAVHPTLKKYAALVERASEKDLIPAAASAEYDWYRRIREAQETCDTLLAEFDDLPSKLDCHVRLVDQLHHLWVFARGLGDKYLRQSAQIVHDAALGVYCENLSKDQAMALRETIGLLLASDSDPERVRLIHRQLRQAGFETVLSDRRSSTSEGSRGDGEDSGG